MTIFTAQNIFFNNELLSNLFVEVTEGEISRIGLTSDLDSSLKLIDFGPVTIFPGFFDIQLNGGGGVLFNDHPTVEALKTVSHAHRKFGTTAFLPTLISDDISIMNEMSNAVEYALKNGVQGVKGIHFEGPFLNPDRKGVHNAKHMAQKENQFIELLDRFELGKVLVTLAPERVSDQFIRELARRNVRVSAGHTRATYEQVLQASEAGLTGFTHLFNAMPPLLSREPGVVGAAFQLEKTYASFIADGHHIHPAVLNHALKTLGNKRAILISDAMPSAASDLTNFMLGDLAITVKDKKCLTPNGTLAGSAITLSEAVIYCINQIGISIENAIPMASITPAHFMGLNHQLGSIKVGKDANLITYDRTGNFNIIELTDY